MNAVSVVACLALFVTVGFAFIFAALLLGRFLRPSAPTPEKRQTYECGEQPIGSSFIQFDLRFYVVALVFLIFDVEVSFFFPWATVYGKATQLMAAGAEASARADEQVNEHLRALGVPETALGARLAPGGPNASEIAGSARQLARMAIIDVGVFFAVLLVGFAYVWSRGDLEWVRATASDSPASEGQPGEAVAA